MIPSIYFLLSMDASDIQSTSLPTEDLADISPFDFNPDDLLDELFKSTAEDPSSPTASSTNLLEVITTNRGKPMVI